MDNYANGLIIWDGALWKGAVALSDNGRRRALLTPFCGGVQTAENRPEADEQQPVVAGERQVAQHDDDDANDEQYQHEHRDPRLAYFFFLRYRWCVTRTGGRATI